MITLPLLPPAPPSLLIDEKIPFGRYAGPIADLETSRWDAEGFLSARRFQRKAWLYFGAFSERYMIGFAIVDAGYVGNAFIYVYDREKKLLVEEKASVPIFFGKDFRPRLHGEWKLNSGGKVWSISPDTEGGWGVVFQGKRLRVSMEFAGNSPGMSTLAPVLRRPFHYTYKVCGMPTRVELEVDGEKTSIEAAGTLDFTLGYPARHTDWNWASLAGTTEDGRRFALNVVAHFTNGLENAYWLDGRIVPLGQAIFHYDARNIQKPWRIQDAGKTFDLHFQPDGQRAETISLGFLASEFTQPFGRFQGSLSLDGRDVKVSGFGVTEEHRAVW